MIALTHPVTGHQISVDDESAEFWQGAGFRADEKSKTTKAPAKKATSRKTSAKK